MTIIGSAGCTFLILIAFAIKDSVNGIGYDNLIILNNEIEEIDEDLSNILNGKVENPILINQTSYKVVDENNNLGVYMIVPESTNNYFDDYFVLKDEETKRALTLNDDGVIITPKISKRFNINKGDEVTLEDLDKNQFKTKVVEITSNYVSNYVYMTNNLYEKIFNEKIKYNTIISKNIDDKETLLNELIAQERILSINFSDDLLDSANSAIGGSK